MGPNYPFAQKWGIFWETKNLQFLSSHNTCSFCKVWNNPYSGSRDTVASWIIGTQSKLYFIIRYFCQKIFSRFHVFWTNHVKNSTKYQVFLWIVKINSMKMQKFYNRKNKFCFKIFSHLTMPFSQKKFFQPMDFWSSIKIVRKILLFLLTTKINYAKTVKFCGFIKSQIFLLARISDILQSLPFLYQQVILGYL